jgi:hypothetical protein
MAYGTECSGCNELEGKVSWAGFYGSKLCPIFACVKDKKLFSCSECGLAPCKVWLDTRNPDATDEEFTKDINSRLANLNANK